MSDSFVHLHVHTEYSMLDGAARLKDLFAEADRLGMPALAMTDHGNLFGAYDFYKQAVAAGIKPVIGSEMYLTPGTYRGDRTRVRWADGGENDGLVVYQEQVMAIAQQLAAGGAVHRRGRHRGGQGSGGPPGRPAEADGDGPVHPGDHRAGRGQAGGARAAAVALHPTPGGTASGGADQPSRPGRGARQAGHGSRATLLRLGPVRVAPTTALMADLKALLGSSAVTGVG